MGRLLLFILDPVDRFWKTLPRHIEDTLTGFKRTTMTVFKKVTTTTVFKENNIWDNYDSLILSNLRRQKFSKNLQKRPLQQI